MQTHASAPHTLAAVSLGTLQTEDGMRNRPLQFHGKELAEEQPAEPHNSCTHFCTCNMAAELGTSALLPALPDQMR